MSLVFCHTADWHLGRTLHGASLELAHRRFLAWLVEVIVARAVDVLVVAGDVFDRSVPPAGAEALFYGFLAELSRAAPGVQVIVIAGNHDGPARLSAPAPLLERLGGAARMPVRIFGSLGLDARGRIDPAAALVPLTTRDGALAGHLVAVPFLRPSDLSRVAVADADQPDTPLSRPGEPLARCEEPRCASERLVRDLVAHAIAATGQRSLLMAAGHGLVRGARLSPESERPLLGGDEAALSVEAFPRELAYVAMGHLHLAQGLDGGRLRYAGAPLPLAFSERAYPHQVVVGTARDGAVALEAVHVPPFVELVRIEGEGGEALDVETAIARLGAMTPCVNERWVQVRVRVPSPRPALRRELGEALAPSGARLVSVDLERAGDAALVPVSSSAYAELAPDAVLARVWSSVSREPLPEALTRALHEAWREAQLEQDDVLAGLPEASGGESADLEVAS
ncbi:MAG: exonuclease subunit SbcD [Sandaracinaceae bacterium]|nr:exonuclease subunit SbcD [Sandaracinaceae bacterium]